MNVLVVVVDWRMMDVGDGEKYESRKGLAVNELY